MPFKAFTPQTSTVFHKRISRETANW